MRVGQRPREATRGVREQAVDDATDPRAEDGFSIVETCVALGVIFAVMLGLLSSLDVGVKGLLTGRQRTGASALAKEVIEEARFASYDRLGHDLVGDATLADDPSITGVVPALRYQPEGLSAEDLVGAASPSYPEHEWTVTRDQSTFTVRVYVTGVSVAAGNDYKRLTVAVEWAGEQYDPSAIDNRVRLSTLVSRFGVASGAEVMGLVDVDSGSVEITGALPDVDLSRAELFFPYAHGDGEGKLVTEARGYAGSARSELDLASGSASGCGMAGASTRCSGAKAETAVDNDGGTALPLQDAVGPTTAGAGTLSAGTPLSLILGATSSLTSKSSAESCITCVPAVGDGDALVYGEDVAAGPGSMSAAFVAGVVSGNLVNISGVGSATATVDSDVAGADQRVTSTGRLVVPQVDLVTLDAGPVGFISGVRISGVDVTAQTQAGPASGPPTVTGDAVTVTMYDTGASGSPAYRSVIITPGTAASESASVSFPVLGVATVTLDTTVTSGPASVTSQSSGGTTTRSSATLSNWFVVTSRMRIVQGAATLADITVELNYGRVGSSSEYTA
ncbi:MAG TPA: hypothetical protein VI916_10135 [Acidimicrobiia bacterium]|nr:hypothetical protein [Acidimicrobiia bacterium]